MKGFRDRHGHPTNLDWTIEDARIHDRVIRKLMGTLEGRGQRALNYTVECLVADRRDAEQMHALTHLDLGCPRCKVFGLRSKCRMARMAQSVLSRGRFGWLST